MTFRQTQVRRLARDDPDPPGRPQVRQGAPGYKWLRWKVGPASYVERSVRDDGAPKRAAPRQLDVPEIRRLYAAGLSTRTISERTGINKGTVSKVLAREGVARRTSTDYATPLDEDKVVRLYQEGHGIRTTARLVGVEDPRRVARLLARRGLVRAAHRPKGQRDKAGSYESEFRQAKKRVRVRSGGRCEAPMSPECTGRAVPCHHRKLRTQGGSNELDNLLDLCPRCHLYAHDHPAEGYAAGVLVHEWDNPAAVPIVLPGALV